MCTASVALMAILVLNVFASVLTEQPVAECRECPEVAQELADCGADFSVFMRGGSHALAKFSNCPSWVIATSLSAGGVEGGRCLAVPWGCHSCMRLPEGLLKQRTTFFLAARLIGDGPISFRRCARPEPKVG